MRQKGFTLIELLLVLAIIGILSGIAIPVLMGQRERARVTAAQANARAVQTEIRGQIGFSLAPAQVITNVLANANFKYPSTKNPFGGSDNILVKGASTKPGEVGIEFISGGGIQPDGTPGDVYRVTWQTREAGTIKTYSEDVPAS